MLQVRVIPTLLLKDQGLVKTVKFDKPKYVGDAFNAVKIFNEKEVDELVFLDISATLQNRPPKFTYIADIASECFMPFSYGGGLKTIADMQQIFKLGAEKVIINSQAVDTPPLVRQAADLFGNQSVVVSIDVKKNLLGKYEVFTHSGTRNRRLDPVDFAHQMQEQGAGELLITAIDRDGTMSGYDTNLLKKITDRVSIPVVACGGAGSLADFRLAIREGGASAVAAGSMFVFHGKHRAVLITYPSRAELEEIFRTD